MFRSLKFQISLVLITLIGLLLIQGVISRGNSTRFFEDISRSQRSVLKVELVRELEKDVIDVQRYVLIYKQTASNSVLVRFETIYQKINNNLVSLENIIQQDQDVDAYRDLISRMRSHLIDYKENFETVVEGRSRRKAIFDEKLSVDLDKLALSLKQYEQSGALTADQKAALNSARYHLSQAHMKTLEYLISPSPSNIDAFKQEITDTRQLFSESDELAPIAEDLKLSLSNLSADFLQLTQITRGYLFLINVVMAGSANEFLYLAKELSQLVTTKQELIYQQIVQSADQSQDRNEAVTGFSIALAFFATLFLVYRVLLPIAAISKVFNLLADGLSIGKIPHTHRKDEIGKLASAAQVFHEKNMQTRELLEHSKLLNVQQQQLNKELASSSLKAEQATQSKSIFLANMSHEIRTPMNGIIGLVDIVLNTKLDEQQREYLEKVAYSTQILMSLINDILDFSKIEAGKLDIESVQFCPDSLFENLLSNISVKAQEKNLNIHFYANPHLPNSLIGDPLRISQILLNLSTNAVKFTNEGTISINVDFVNKDDNTITLILNITDTGIGMDEEQLKSIFNPFTQADGSTSRQFGGTGLGLSIVHQLVELMNGQISVGSELNQGSEFVVHIDLQVNRQEQKTVACDAGLKVYYYSTAAERLTPEAYLQCLDEDYIQLTEQNFSIQLQERGEEAFLLIEVENIIAYKTVQSKIAEAQAMGAKVGLVTNTQPSTLPHLLEQKWQYPVISQPFTTQSFRLFIERIRYGEVMAKTLHLADAQQELPQFKGHLLLVEDNHINQLVAVEMLKKMGVSYDIAEDGQQAVTKIVNSSHYDLVLMDIQMPVMDGYTATSILRDKGFKELIICGLSANAMNEDHDKALEVGMNNYLTKPIKQDALQKMLSKYLTIKA
ncbi:ATP-binding protein [Aliiglaciecola sp. LCG003]|uniref:ATP-binding protein n=1 Tax=Aliiglaciecola sp. LCG003 TaxID=3053655 RepID=UPI0025742994|nr:ATP-binding protein [Aliiglaciecola sp. LCG003]WJG08671.1 ATP-binding protein [Aliiglaciecola sp. LCG003]